MIVQFVNGSIYAAANMPKSEYYNLIQSSSPGAYFHSKLKGRNWTMIQGPSNRRRRR
jgi:hypothetical protein